MVWPGPFLRGLLMQHGLHIAGLELSFDEAEVLKDRAEAFLRNAEHLLKVEEWDLAAFSLEQYCQLILKYKLLLKSGSYPRMHSLRELIQRLKEYNPKIGSLLQGDENLLYVTKLEDAYIVTRYLPRRYTREEVIALHKFVKGVLREIVSKV